MKNSCQFLIKLIIHLPYDLAISLLGIYLRISGVEKASEPREHILMSGAIFGCSSVEGGGHYGHLVGKDKEVPNYLTMHRTTPTKNYVAKMSVAPSLRNPAFEN